jgi:hypothetical protein
MKSYNSQFFVPSVILAMSTAALTAGCKGNRGMSYHFESQGRNVLAQCGVAPTKDPKLALSSSGALHLLAVYGDEGQAQLGLAISHDGGDTMAPPCQLAERATTSAPMGKIALT